MRSGGEPSGAGGRSHGLGWPFICAERASLKARVAAETASGRNRAGSKGLIRIVMLLSAELVRRAEAPAAVDDDLLAGDVLAGRRGQEQGQPRHVLGPADAV